LNRCRPSSRRIIGGRFSGRFQFRFHFDARCFARQLKGVPLQLLFTHGKRHRAVASDRNYQHLGADIDPASDINPALVNSLKALDPNRPIREADIATKRQILPKTYSKWYKANVDR